MAGGQGKIYAGNLRTDFIGSTTDRPSLAVAEGTLSGRPARMLIGRRCGFPWTQGAGWLRSRAHGAAHSAVSHPSGVRPPK
jgi:hypothetical protein